MTKLGLMPAHTQDRKGLALKVDPGLIRLMGKKLYKTEPLPLCVRELLQNSLDACQRKGVKPSILVDIDFTEGHDCLLVVEDNGIGMTPEQVEEDFLHLGHASSQKYTDTSDDRSLIGGFGVAKVTLMANPYWSCETLDWEFNSDDVENGNEIRESKSHRDGTRIAVRIQNAEDQVRDTIRIIYTSEVDIDFTVWKDGMVIFRDPHAGRRGNMAVDQRIRNTATENTAVFSVEEEWRAECTESGSGYQIARLDVVRINGLTQVVSYSYGDRKSNLYIDLSSPHRPHDQEYPMSASRETISDRDIGVEFDNWRRKKNIDSMSTDSIVKERQRENDPKYTNTEVAGYLASGTRQTDLHDPNSYRSCDLEELEKYRGDSISILYRHIDLGETKVDMKDLENVLIAWVMCLEAVSADPNFGIGVTGDGWEVACRLIYNTMVYYLINPVAVLERLRTIKTPHGRATALYALAVHEATHQYRGEHDETFAKYELIINSESADAFAEVVNDVMKYLARLK